MPVLTVVIQMQVCIDLPPGDMLLKCNLVFIVGKISPPSSR